MPKREALKQKSSTGNVFADLGLADAGEHLIKAGLVVRIDRTIRRRNLTQATAARLMGIDQPRLTLTGELCRPMTGIAPSMSGWPDYRNVQGLPSRLKRYAGKTSMVNELASRYERAPATGGCAKSRSSRQLLTFNTTDFPPAWGIEATHPSGPHQE
jgi:hypothetical protein